MTRIFAAYALSALAVAPLLAQVPSPSGQMRGVITTARRTPAVGAVVMVRPEGAPTPIRVGTTGASGRFAFDGLADGTYRAEVRREGYTPVVKSGIEVKAPFRAVVEVALVRGSGTVSSGGTAADPQGGTGSVHLTVRTSPESPLAEARVRLVQAEGREDPRASLTDSTGKVSFESLPAGTWRLEILGAGLLPLRAALDVAGEISVEATMSPQPADYQPAPQDLIVPEEATPPSPAPHP